MWFRNAQQPSGSRLLLVVLLFTVALAALILLINAQESILQGSAIAGANPAGLAGVDASELGAWIAGQVQSGLDQDIIAVQGLVLHFQLTPPGGSGEASNSIQVKLDDIAYFMADGDPQVKPERLCIDAIRMGFLSSPAFVRFGAVLLGGDLLAGSGPLCAELGAPIDANPEVDIYYSSTFLEADDQQAIDRVFARFPTDNAFFRYPYDQFAVEGALQVDYSVLSGDAAVTGGKIIPTTAWLYQTSSERNWNVALESEDAEKRALEDTPADIFGVLDTGAYQKLKISFSRPLLFRLAYPFLILAMLVFIGLLPFLGSLEALLGTTAGLLFGIFSLRQLLSPPGSQGQTLLDLVFVGLYMVLAFALVLIIATRAYAAWRARNQPEPT